MNNEHIAMLTYILFIVGLLLVALGIIALAFQGVNFEPIIAGVDWVVLP